MELVLPSAEYKHSFIEAIAEYEQGEPNIRSEHYLGLSIPELEADFDSYVEKILGQSQGLNLREGYVPQTTYWLVDGNEFIGRASIRHRLNEHLTQVGGHIGYDIRPSKRGQGYGKKILELALEKAKELGITRALITCDETNMASRRVVEKNGGILENIVENPESDIRKMRFWISI